MTETLPGDLGLPTLSKLYVDGMPLDALNAGIALNAGRLASTRESFEQGFFSTPTRPNGDTTRDVFEMSLSTPQRVNRVTFSLAHFPQRAWVQYFDQVAEQWANLVQDNGLSATITIQDSIPPVISSGVSDSTHIHPQHFGSGHWATYDFKVKPVSASRLRIVMTRLTAETIPLSTLGLPVDYSLGVKDFNVGYVVASRADLPILNRSSTSVTERESFAASSDLLGSSVEYAVRENRASDLLAGNGAIWKSAPQPYAESVVCLYVDARNAQGFPQVVDSFSLDPLHSGSTVNLYFSVDVPTPGRFPASENPLSFPLSRPYGAVPPTANADGILFPATTSFLDVDNMATQFDPTQPFQMHGMVQPQFPSTQLSPVVLYDDGILKLSWGLDPTGTTPYGALVASLGSMTATWLGVRFAFNSRLPFTITFDGSRLVLESPLGRIESMSGEIPPGTNPPQTLRIGGSLTTDPTAALPGNFRLCSLMIKQGNPDGDDAKAAYWANPHLYTVTPEYPGAVRTTDNALLRYDPSQQTAEVDSVNPYGLLGGPGVVYEELRWTPVCRDYAVRQGLFRFNPTQARFFKFEFSNLSPEHFETDYPVVLTTQVFASPQETETSPARASAQSANTGGSGMAVNTQVASINRFSDQNRLTSTGSAVATPTSSTTYLPTEAMRVIDAQGAARMDEAAPYWNFSRFQAGATMPRFTATTTHYYETVSVRHTKRIAYFVGLRSIFMYRVDRQIADDEDQYTELFHDANDVVYDPAIPTWALVDGRISTSASLGAPVTMTSKPYNSFRALSGVQFATTQSPPQQLLTDPDFDDVSLQYWQPVGDATIVADPFFNTDVGSLVRVKRGGNPVTWSSMETTYQSFNAIEDSDISPYLPTWDSLQGSTSPLATGGIQSFESIQPSSIGKLYAAARVLSPTSLTAPLTLRLVNGDGTLLAEKPVDVLGNQITEWFVEYNIGDGAPPLGVNLWSELDGVGNTWDLVEEMGNWNEVSAIEGRLDIHDVRVTLSQDQATRDVWYVDNISIFNDPIMWEFSRDGGRTFWPVWDIRNDPNGVFVFPDGDHSAPGGGSNFVWRVTGAAANLAVSALQVRFWFDSLMQGAPFTRTAQHGGPNLSPLDQNPDVSDDPMFKAWHNVIPQDWWYVYRQWVRQHAATPTITQRAFLPHTLPVGVDEGTPQAPARRILPTSIVYPS